MIPMGKTMRVRWGTSCVEQAVEHLEAAALACNPDRVYEVGEQPLTGQDLQCLLDIVRQCDSQHNPVREQLLAALPDEWDTDQPTLADVAAAARDKLQRRTADCERVQEALLPVLREHPLSKDDMQDDVQGDNLRAGDIAKIAAEALQWSADEIERRNREVTSLRASQRAAHERHRAALIEALGPYATTPEMELISHIVDDVTRLREQLATAVVLPHEYEMLERVLRAMQGPNFRGVEHCREYDDVEFEAAEAVVREVRSWGVSSSEAEVPQPQEMTQHEADTLRPASVTSPKVTSNDEGRPSGSERLAPRPMEELLSRLRGLVFDLQDKASPNPIEYDNGWRDGQIQAGSDLEALLDEFAPIAAQAARSEATPEAPRRWTDCRGSKWEDVESGGDLRLIGMDGYPYLPEKPLVVSRLYLATHYGPLTEVPSPSLRKEGEDRG